MLIGPIYSNCIAVFCPVEQIEFVSFLFGIESSIIYQDF